MICCFTGHRVIPKSEYAEVREKLAESLNKLIDEGVTHFIAGGALGFDSLAAEVVLEIREKRNITLEIAVPCLGQEKKWNKKQIANYEDILKKADKVTVLSEKYVTGCMQVRNKYMVDSSDVVVTYYRGKTGGTQQTYFYAELLLKRIINV